MITLYRGSRNISVRNILRMINLPIAALVSVMNFGCLIKLLKRCFFTYSAARAPP
jgi:hypothetical protein